jgi:sulfate permease, SulP family
MATNSSFTPLAPQLQPADSTWRSTLIGALDSSAFGIPLSLGGAAIVFGHLGLELLPVGLFALLMSIALIHVTTARSERPLIYGARIFEATTLAAMVDQFVPQLAGWGLADTSGVRLALFCLICACTGACVGLLYAVRADRLTRLIPAPVFAAFSNSIALALLVSQVRTLLAIGAVAGAAWPVACVALVTFATGVGLRYTRPRWPATTIGLAVGLLLGLAWSGAGRSQIMLGAFGWVPVLPFSLADFAALGAPGVRAGRVAAAIVSDGALLALMVFINTTMTAEAVSQSGGRRKTSGRSMLWHSATVTLTGLAGSVPLSGSINATTIAMRTTALTPALVYVTAAIAALFYLSGVTGLIPLAAVCATLLCEAWFMVDRPSAHLLYDWIRRRPMVANARADLVLIVAVTAVAVLLNMVAAVVAGLLFGLLQFAARNARRPVRQMWTGLQMTSNCARSRADLRLLAEHGGGIRIAELDGDLFFAAMDSLERTLEQCVAGASALVIDWSRVRHIDTSVARGIAQFDKRAGSRGIAPIHAGIEPHGNDAAISLLLHLPHARIAPDLDRALEQAENDVIQLRSSDAPPDATGYFEAAALLQGLREADRAQLEAVMSHQFFRAGDTILEAGSPGDELMLLLHGSASVVVRSADGKQVRLAGVRRGATIGDIAFLDQARRSASVIAEDDTTVAVLGRQQYDSLCAKNPLLVQRLLSNIALNLAARLRHMNRLSLTRQAGP